MPDLLAQKLSTDVIRPWRSSRTDDQRSMSPRARQRFKNTSGLDSKAVRRILRFVMPQNIDPAIRRSLTVWVKKTMHGYAGRYYSGSRHIVARVGLRFPMKLHLYQYAQHRGRRHWLANREEAVVYVLSHELRHFWQNYGKYKGLKFPLGRTPNSRAHIAKSIPKVTPFTSCGSGGSVSPRRGRQPPHPV